jgi:hypothetical protein
MRIEELNIEYLRRNPLINKRKITKQDMRFFAKFFLKWRFFAKYLSFGRKKEFIRSLDIS